MHSSSTSVGASTKVAILTSTCFILICIAMIQARDSITFRSEPQDMFVEVSDTVAFNCNYLSQVNAVWVINELYYAHISILPRKHSVVTNISGSFLIVHNVDLSMNGSTYQCIVESCYSAIGHLYILHGSNNIVTKSSANTESVEPTQTTVTPAHLIHSTEPNFSTYTIITSTSSFSYVEHRNHGYNRVTLPIVMTSTLLLGIICTCILLTVITIVHIKFRKTGKAKAEKGKKDTGGTEFIHTVSNAAYASVTIVKSGRV